jgi:hypothetical protein
MKLQICIVSLFLILIFLSCKAEANMERELLFELSMGRGEDQIDLIQLSNIPFNKKSRIVMKDGLIYIANGNANKVMEFSSYGDILSLYYNPDENPEPVLLTNTTEGGNYSNRNAYTFNFKNIGEIAVSNNNHLLVEDLVPDNRIDYDEETDSTLNRIVLQFDKNGKFLNFLGREGIGGTPFPYIEKIEINNNDDIIIIARTIKTWNLYWYSQNGSLKYTVKIPLDDLPVPPDGEFIPSLETIVTARNNNSVYLKIDYYNKKINNPDYAMSYIWMLDLNKESYTKSIRLPSTENTEGDDIPEFLGINNADKFFFLTHLSDDTFQIMVIKDNGTVLIRSELTMKDEEISYRDLYLDPNGLLVAMLGEYDKVEVVWWRSDQLPGVQDETDKL